MPKLDHEVITLGHGSGGQLTHRLLEASVFTLFNNDQLQQQSDAAIISTPGKTIFSTDSFVVSPIFFPGGNIGDLAVNGTLNDLAVSGGLPRYLSLAFILEEGLKMKDFWEILLTIQQAAKKAGVQIVTGDTKVVEKGKGDQLFINTSGVADLHPKANLGYQKIKPGDRLLISGIPAQHGVSILSVREGLQFETEIRSDTCAIQEMTIILLDQLGPNIHLMRDPTRGGVATSLVEIATMAHLGIKVYEHKIPASEQVAAACELMGLDPLYVANEGLFIAFVAREYANQAMELIRKYDNGQHAAIIGEVTDSHAGKVVKYNEHGGSRILSMLPGEQLPRIC
jgi:hydrogenase expression/formation protein HypE